MHRVNKCHCAGSMGEARDLSNRIDGSHRVGRIAYGHEPRSVAQFAFQVLEVERAVLLANIRYLDDHSLFLKRLPRREIGVMIESSQENLIARPQLSSNRPRQRKGKGGHVLTKDNLARFTMEKIRHCRTRVGNHLVAAPTGQEGSMRIGVGIHKVASGLRQ